MPRRFHSMYRRAVTGGCLAKPYRTKMLHAGGHWWTSDRRGDGRFGSRLHLDGGSLIATSVGQAVKLHILTSTAD